MYNQVLTNSGAELLRDAINNSKKIVFTRAICGSRYDMDSRGDLAAKPIDWYNGADGIISAVDPGAQGLRVIAEFEAVESGTDTVKSACICAQIKKDGMSPTYDDKDDVIFAAWCDDNSCYISGDDIYLKFDLPIALSGIVDPVGEIDPLPDNVVTTDGEDQDITGSLTATGDDGETLQIGGAAITSVSEDETYVSMMTQGVVRVCSTADISAADANVVEYSYEGILIFHSGISGDSDFFGFDTMPLKCEYNTSAGTVDLILGDGTKIRLTCTSVAEVS